MEDIRIKENKELSADERFQCLVAQGIRNQAKKFNKIVAVGYATNFNGIRNFGHILLAKVEVL